MKQKFLTYSLNIINKNNNYDEIKLAELKYGLEGFYITLTKMSIYILISIIFGVFKEFLLFLAFFSPLRGFGFGFHAKNSLGCWLVTTPVFACIPILAKNIFIPNLIVHCFIIFAIISFYLFAPADTKSKPLVNKKKRLLNKCIIVLISIIYLFLTLFFKNHLFINTIMFACLWEAICVNPLMYKIFGQPFNNYKTYLSTV